MKKVFGLLAAAAVLSSGVSFAQTQDQHEVNVKIPEVLRIRLTSGASNAAVDSPTAVEFDFVTDATSFDVGTPFPPSNAGSFNWDDVKVFSNDADGWSVRISTDDTSFDWGKVSVAASGANINPTFTLADEFVAANDDKTGGWESLGFGPENFSIQFDGSEDAGDYSTTVSYDIFGL